MSDSGDSPRAPAGPRRPRSPRRSAGTGGSGVERLYGTHPVAEALRSRRRPLHRLLVRADARSAALHRLVEAARSAGVPVVEVDRAELERRLPPGAKAQGLVLEAGALPGLPLDALCEPAPGGRARRVVALDGIEDPQNVGAIARVAEAAGASGLLLTERRSPPLGAAVSRASAGAVELLPVVRVPNLARAIRTLKQRGFWAVGTAAESGEDLFGADDRALSGDLVVVLGAEGRGLRPGVQAVLDHVVRVPLRGEVQSLNVSAAAAVVLFEIARREGVARRA